MKIPKLKQKTIVNAVIFLAIFFFLLSYFNPNLILLDTTTSGGDTGSHNYPFWYLKHVLLPDGRLSGWSPGWYAGFPIFQFYFIVPFLLMAAFSYVLPFWVSFKTVTILGTLLLPITAYYATKLMGFKFPTPAIAALFTLPFLFMEANSMWGGNIPSTLAGEFSYSLSFAFAILFLGLIYHVIRIKQKSAKLWITTAVVFALVLLCHIYTAFFVGIVPIFFLLGGNKKTIADNFKKNFIQLFKIYFLAFLLSAFWTVPLLMKTEYATPYHYVWKDIQLNDVFPKILMPFVILALVGIYDGFMKSDDRIKYLLFASIVSYLLYRTTPMLGMTDIRFIPFLQLIPTIIAACYISNTTTMKTSLKHKRSIMILIFIITVLTLLWVQNSVTYIDFWIKWNYEGFQSKQHWKQLNDITSYLSKLPYGRVVHEYSNSHDKFGTPRTFENIPLFTGKPTLEGLNIESSLSSPYVFVIQAEMSASSTCPIPGLRCGTFNIKAAEKHLELFNIRYIVATTDKLKNAINNDTAWPLLNKFEEIEIYEVGNTNYTSIPEYKPLVFKKQGTNWKEFSFEWFKQVKDIDVPIVFVDDTNSIDHDNFGPTISSLDEITRISIDSDCNILSEEVWDNELKIKTDCIGKPLLIKISYFPNWKVEGADKIYLVSPSFMMIFPEQEDVRLYYGYTFSDHLGTSLTIIGIIMTLLFAFGKIELQKTGKHFS